jgi:hypothetical protein
VAARFASFCRPSGPADFAGGDAAAATLGVAADRAAVTATAIAYRSKALRRFTIQFPFAVMKCAVNRPSPSMEGGCSAAVDLHDPSAAAAPQRQRARHRTFRG